MLLLAVALAATPREFDRRLAESPPELVILGNSKVTTDIDLDLVRQQLPTLPPTTPLGVFGSKGPVWYAVLRNRVWAAGLRPKTVLVYGPLGNALPLAMAPAELAGLVPWLADEEVPALSRWFGSWNAEARAAWTPAGGGCEGPRKALPEVEPPPGDLVADSVLAALLRDAAAHGAQVVFAPHPVAPSSKLAALPEPELLARELALLRESGAKWLDLRRDFRDEAWYGDGTHMSAAGRRRFSGALAGRLAELGRLGPPPEAPELRGELSGSFSPSFSPLGDCGWEAPLPAGWERLDDERLRAAGLGATVPLALSLRGRPLPHLRVGACGHGWWVEGGRLRLEARAPIKAIAASLAEGVDEDGLRAWWIGPGLTLRLRAATATLTALAPTWVEVDGARRRLSGSAQVRLDGDATLRAGDFVAVRVDPPARTVDLRQARWTWLGPAPTLALGASRSGPRPGSVQVEVATVPAEAEIFREAGAGACDPLRTDEDLALVHLPGQAQLSRKDCTALEPGPAPPLRLAEDRACREGHARWLYPGDRVRIEAEPALGPAATLVLAGGVPGDPGGKLQVDVLGPTPRSSSFPLAALREGPLRLPLRGEGPLRLELASEGWVLLTRVALEAP